MHASTCDVDFSIMLPPSTPTRIVVPEFSDTYAKLSDSFIIASIIRNADRFYKPRIPCRRLFTSTGVRKIFPAVQEASRKNNTFLHKNKERNPLYRRSISLLNPSIAYEKAGYFPANNIKFICEEFLIAERIASSETTDSLHSFSLTNKQLSKSRLNRLSALNIIPNKANSGYNNSRYSFNILNSSNDNEVSILLTFGICMLFKIILLLVLKK